MLRNFTPYLNYIYPKITKLGWAGLCLALCALMFLVFNITFQQKKLEQIKADITEIEKSANLIIQRDTSKESTKDVKDELELHKRTELLDIFEYIQTTAKNNNIIIESEDYKLTELPIINSSSYEVKFPATGKYADFRKLISQIEQKYSGVALKNIELSRESNQANVLDGFLQIVIYVKN